MLKVDGVGSWLATQTWPDLRKLITQGPITLYEHPYGFVVCRLETEWFPGWQVRVHLWPEREQMERDLRANGVADQLVHCHGWDLKSAVCLGALNEFHYELARGSNEGQCIYRIVSDYAVGSSKLVLQEDHVRPVLLSEQRYDMETGLRFIEAGQFHAAIVAGGPTVSVVATSRVHGGESLVIGPPTADPSPSNDRRGVEDIEGALSRYDDIYRGLVMGADRWASFVFLVDDDNQVLAVRSNRSPKLWQPVGGRSEVRDQDPLATVVREAKEEIGIKLDPRRLVELKVVDRDVGEGMVHFWATRVRTHLAHVDHTEIVDSKWVSVNALAQLPMYAGTKMALEALQSYLEQV
jgi:8-oxo-dGTP pyrophosphatase MutT (NUDIX family)